MLMVTSTIAAVFGFLEIFGLGMIIGERFEDYLKFRLSKRVNLQSILEAREEVVRSFEYQTGRNRLTKITPLRIDARVQPHIRNKSIRHSESQCGNTTQISEV
jgi:hypothetical protein